MKLVPLSDRVVLKQLKAEETTKSEIRLHEIWIQDFCKNVSTEVRRWIQDLDYK